MKSGGKLSEELLRSLIREWIGLEEGIFNGVTPGTTPAATGAAEKAAAQRAAATASTQAAKTASAALKSTVAGVRKDVPDDPEELRKVMKDFKIEKVKDDPKADDLAIASALSAIGNRKLPPSDVDRIFKDNPSLGSAATSMKGGAEFEKAVEKGLEAKGTKPGDTAATWNLAGDIAKKQGLA